MKESEKKAYDYLKKYIKWETFGERNLEGDIKTILKLIEKQQKRIEDLNKEKRILIEKYTEVVYECGKRNKEIQELSHFKEEVIDIIKYADDTAEPTYWNIRKLLGE